MSNDDRAKKKLSAAVTVTGAVLCLTTAGVTGNRAAHASLNDATSTRRPLSQRVEEMREKVRAALSLSNSSGPAWKIQNIVQFFNFLNCAKTPTDPRCRR
jgi:predicted aconitase